MAKRKGLVRANPFHHLKAGGEENATRQRFIERPTIDRAIEYAPDIQWKLIIALARYGGLRCPSEVLALTWADIDWAGGRFTVTSSKTKRQGKAHRVVPLFPELRPLLEEASMQADKGLLHVITKYRQKKCQFTDPVRADSEAGRHRTLGEAVSEPAGVV
jgi:integrase